MFSFQLHPLGPLPRGRGGEIGSCVFFLNSLHPLRVAEAAARVRRSKTRFDVLIKFVPELQNNLLEQAQVGLGHAFSRCKVKAPS